MTTEQLAKMRAGREAANRRRTARQQAKVGAYREFLAAERHSYVAMLRAASEFGRSSDEFREAEDSWRRCWCGVELPTDADFAAAA